MKPNELSFVVQGEVIRETSPLTGRPVTQSSLESLRLHFPEAEVILSTWQGTSVDALSFDKVVFSEDPGNWNTARPGAALKLDNTNRQIVSTRNGLREAS